MSVEQCTEILHRIADLLPDKKLIFTVSPIRHFKDGAHGNQISKSTLLLAIDNIVSSHANCKYFPSYEIMMDELRDYRYYADDMLHPSTKAVEYIWECFSKCYFSKETQALCIKTAEITRALLHRPFDAKSASYRLFVEQTLEKIEKLSKRKNEL
mgnify:CR=1 FL=1